MARISFEFTGTKSTPLSLDPREYHGLSVPAITAALRGILRSMDADVDFFSPDIEFAAATLKEQSGG